MEFPKTLTPKDRLWRIQNLYLIRDKKRRRRPLRLNNVQRRIVEAMVAGKPIRHYDLKFRQGGISTFWLIYYLDDTIFNANTITCILAQKQESLNHLWEVVRFAHESMPKSCKPIARTDTAKTLIFEGTNSKMFVSTRVQSVGLHNLHASEYPLCDSLEIEQTLAACPPDANITLEGVANGMNHAYDKWREANEYTKLFHPWYVQEEYRLPVVGKIERDKEELRLTDYAKREYGIKIDDEQIAFRRQKKKELKSLFYQEMAEDPYTCFLSSGNPFFDNRKVAVLKTEAEEYLAKHPPEIGDDWIMWEKPQRGHIYAGGGDVAEGLQITDRDTDYSVLSILCVTCKRQAFRYRARVGVEQFYHVCNDWGIKYNKALLAPERNNHGAAIIMGLREDCKYPNLYYEESARTSAFGSDKIGKNRKYGWNTDTHTRPIMLDQIKQALEGEFADDEEHFSPRFSILDIDFLNECFSFHNVDGKLQAAARKHDDIVFANAIAYQMYLRQEARSKGISQDGIIVGGKTESSKVFGDGPV